MAKFEAKIGGKNLNAKIYALGKNAQKTICASLKSGAGVFADAIRSGIESLPEDTGITKKGLQDGLGISPVQQNGGVYDVKVGFEGYNQRGVPNAMMARIMESGTSTTQKHPFVRPAVENAKKQARAAMRKTFDEECEKIMKG